MIFSLSLDVNLLSPAQLKGLKKKFPDIFLISRCESSQSRTVKRAEKGFLDIGLDLNLEKCEYICFNCTLPNTPLQIKNTSIPSVETFRWLGFTSCKKKEIRFEYFKIVSNRSKYNRKVFVSSCSVLFTSFCTLSF